MMRNGLWIVPAVVLAATGCAKVDFQDALGFGKDPPDEYQVLQTAPLAVPPDYHLRPPRPGELSRVENDNLRRRAEALVIGVDSARNLGTGRSPGETAFLDRAGALEVDPAIRRQVDQEGAAWISQNEGVLDPLLFWQDDRPPPADLVDPAAETRRLLENSENGLPVTHGETPIIEHQTAGPLEDLNIFN